MPKQNISEALGQWDKNSYNKSFIDERGVDATRAPVYTRIHAYTCIGRSVLSVQLSQQRVNTTGVHNTTSTHIFKIDFPYREEPACRRIPALAYIREKLFSCVTCDHKGMMSYPSIGLGEIL